VVVVVDGGGSGCTAGAFSQAVSAAASAQAITGAAVLTPP
jgi:hypothetical protein